MPEKEGGKKLPIVFFTRPKEKDESSIILKNVALIKKKSRKNMKRKTRALAKSIKKLRGGSTQPDSEPKDDRQDEGVREEKGDVGPPNAPPNIPFGMRPDEILQR